MDAYEEQAYVLLTQWRQNMQKKPSLANRIAKGLQNKINSIIPEKAHKVITVTIEKMVKAVLFGAKVYRYRPACARCFAAVAGKLC
jgi:hypothetical protein